MCLDVPDPLLLELVHHCLGGTPGVGEDQGGGVVPDQLSELIVHPRIHHLEGEEVHVLHRADHLEVKGLPLRHLHDVDGPEEMVMVREVVDGGRGVLRGEAVTVSHQEAGDLLDGGLGGTEPDADRGVRGIFRGIPFDQGLEALQGEGEHDTPLRARELVDLVHDDVADPMELLAEPGGGQDQAQGLRGGDEDMGRFPCHLRAFRGGRIP